MARYEYSSCRLAAISLKLVGPYRDTSHTVPEFPVSISVPVWSS